MWDGVWDELTTGYDVLRLDLRGYGDSTLRPVGPLDPVHDVLATCEEVGVGRCHVVGASYGAGVAVEAALARPELVASLLLSAPGGSLMPVMTPSLRAFFDAERAALGAGDLDAAVEANLATWVDGNGRDAADVAPDARDLVGRMQRRAFEVTADWGEVEEVEPDPPALERLGEVMCPTTVLVGDLDLDVIHDAADRLTAGIPGARREDWTGVAHLPSMERPREFVRLVESHLGRAE